MKRMIKWVVLFAFVAAAPALVAPAMAGDGLVRKQSSHSVADTVARFEAVLKKKGVTVFARVDHAAGAKKVGQDLPPTTLVIFGSPKMGTPLMAAKREAGIDLPLKLLVWQDGAGKTWLAYNDPAYLKSRHNVMGRDKLFGKMGGVLDALTNAAIK